MKPAVFTLFVTKKRVYRVTEKPHWVENPETGLSGPNKEKLLHAHTPLDSTASEPQIAGLPF